MDTGLQCRLLAVVSDTFVSTNQLIFSYTKFEVVSTTAPTAVDCELSSLTDDGLFVRRIRTVVTEPEGSGEQCAPLTVYVPFVEPTCGKLCIRMSASIANVCTRL